MAAQTLDSEFKKYYRIKRIDRDDFNNWSMGWILLVTKWNLEMIESDSKYLFKFYLSKTLESINLRTFKAEVR